MSRNKIVYGQWTFEDQQIQHASLYLSTSLLSDSLEANTFSADVTCSDRSILDFERNTPLVYSRAGRQLGIFYVQDITRIGPAAYTISATSAIGMLVEGLHYGGIYSGETVSELLPGICGSVPYEIKGNLQSIALYGWLPAASPRDNLSQVLFAIGATVKTDLDGVLRIEGLWDGISGSIGENRLYQGQRVEYAAKVTRVVVTEHQYIEGTEETEVFSGTAQAGDVITFSEPLHSLSATGFTITESGANYAVLSAGTGVLSGKSYIHNTRQVSRDVSQSYTENVVTVEDATLVSLVNSVSVAERLAAYYACRETISGDILLDRQAPGDVVTAFHPYDQETVQACIESLDIRASNTLRATAAQLVGFHPLQMSQTETYTEHVILTGSGIWIPPEGTTSVRAVLIGAGQAGYNGANGGSAPRSSGDFNHDTDNVTLTPSSSTRNYSISSNSQGGQEGTGGEGGQPGTPGKIYDVTFEIGETTQFAYSCGIGGSTNGQSGGETTFGEYSSAQGETSPAGYTDLIDGTTYAATGVAGGAGADGGSAGQNGESSDGATGGYTSGDYSDSDEKSSEGDFVTGWGRLSLDATASIQLSGAGGGGAGGSSGSNHGQNGGNAYLPYPVWEMNSSGGWSADVYIYPAQGGIGGNGANGAPGQTYGSSGSGGGGGGGAGAIGGSSGNLNVTVGYPSPMSSTTGTTRIAVSITCNSNRGTAVNGGTGGAGGSGADGCIILYFGVQKTIKNGAVMGADNKIRLDKLGRLMVG